MVLKKPTVVYSDVQASTLTHHSPRTTSSPEGSVLYRGAPFFVLCHIFSILFLCLNMQILTLFYNYIQYSVQWRAIEKQWAIPYSLDV